MPLTKGQKAQFCSTGGCNRRKFFKAESLDEHLAKEHRTTKAGKEAKARLDAAVKTNGKAPSKVKYRKTKATAEKMPVKKVVRRQKANAK